MNAASAAVASPYTPWVSLMTDVSLTLTTCPERETLTLVTPMSEHYTLIYCPEGTHTKMRAISKTILFGKVTHDRKIMQWPVAAFANTDDARAYAAFLRLAYRASDETSILALDPKRPQDDGGVSIKGVKWSLLTVPYAPQPAMDSDDDEVKDETVTS